MSPQSARKKPTVRKPGGAPALASLADLTPDPQNARKHGERNLETIRASLEEVGAARSIVIDEAGVILAGNATVEAATEAGLKLQVVDTDAETLVAVRRTGLTAAQKARLALFDNRAAELADGWDTGVLKQLQEQGIGFGDLWNDDELADLFDLAGGAKDGLTDPDQVPEPRATDIQPGDVFELGAHRLACADAGSQPAVWQLLGTDKIDLVVTSPPYNVNIKYRSHVDKATRDEYLAFIRGVASAFVPHMAAGRFVAWNIGVSPKTYPAHQVVTLEDCGLTFYRQVVWQKSGVAYPIFPSSIKTKRARHYKPNYTHEVIQVFETTAEGDLPLVPCALCEGGGTMVERELPMPEEHDTIALMTLGDEELGERRIPDRRYQNDVWQIHQSQSTVGLKTVGDKSGTLKHGGSGSHRLKEHPAPFPVELPRVVASFLTSRGEIVYEPFGGSGSTLIACEQMERRARVVEIDPVYCQIVIDRWEAFTGRKAVKVA